MREYFRVLGEPVTAAAEEALVAWAGGRLPKAYLSLLRETNGAEWCTHDSGGDCLQIWKAEEVKDFNEGYHVQRWLPDTLAFASDGGGDALLLDCAASANPEEWPVVRVGLGALDREEFCIQAHTFSAWATGGFRLMRTPPPAFDLPTRSEVAEDVAKILRTFPEGDEPF